MAEVDLFNASDVLVGESSTIQLVRDQLRRAACTELPVLLIGESGTGKNLVARLLHESSAMRHGEFLRLDCSILPTESFERDLLGSLNEAQRSFSLDNTARSGTLFLDNVDELDAAYQAKLLLALRESQAVRQDDSHESQGLRIICASGRRIEDDVARGDFRSDLFYRLNVMCIRMPPLREHIDDLPLLMHHFVTFYTRQFGANQVSISKECTDRLMSYQWPGNIRELENVAKRFVVLGSEEEILASIMPRFEEERSIFLDSINLNLPLRVQTKRALQQLERRIILGVLEAHRWNRRKTARSLDISYRALLYKMKGVQLPMPLRDSREPSEAFLGQANLEVKTTYRN